MKGISSEAEEDRRGTRKGRRRFATRRSVHRVGIMLFVVLALTCLVVYVVSLSHQQDAPRHGRRVILQ